MRTASGHTIPGCQPTPPSTRIVFANGTMARKKHILRDANPFLLFRSFYLDGGLFSSPLRRTRIVKRLIELMPEKMEGKTSQKESERENNNKRELPTQNANKLVYINICTICMRGKLMKFWSQSRYKMLRKVCEIGTYILSNIRVNQFLGRWPFRKKPKRMWVEGKGVLLYTWYAVPN